MSSVSVYGRKIGGLIREKNGRTVLLFFPGWCSLKFHKIWWQSMRRNTRNRERSDPKWERVGSSHWVLIESFTEKKGKSFCRLLDSSLEREIMSAKKKGCSWSRKERKAHVSSCEHLTCTISNIQKASQIKLCNILESNPNTDYQKASEGVLRKFSQKQCYTNCPLELANRFWAMRTFHGSGDRQILWEFEDHTTPLPDIHFSCQERVML